jgi:hypothetical protein
MRWFHTTLVLMDGDGLGEIGRVAMAHEGKIISFSRRGSERTFIRRVRMSPGQDCLEAHDPVADEWVSLEPPTVVFGNDGVALAHPHMRTLVNNAADGMLVLDSGCADSKGLGRRLTARAGGPLTTGSSK